MCITNYKLGIVPIACPLVILAPAIELVDTYDSEVAKWSSQRIELSVKEENLAALYLRNGSLLTLA
jgi:hypothetical protein